MIISWRRKFLFVHIYKNAGTSLRDAFKPAAAPALEWWLAAKMLRLGIRTRYLPHTVEHLTALEIRDWLGPARYDGFYSFAFVSNPFRWQISLYNEALRNPVHPQHALTRGFGSYDAYLEWRVAEDLHSQSEFVCDAEGRQIVRFIGRLEHLQEDFDRLCKELGVAAKLRHLHRNPALRTDIRQRESYRDYYNAHTRRLIETHFAQDLDRFGYRF